MQLTSLPVTYTEHAHPIPGVRFADLLIPALHKGEKAHTHQLCSASLPTAVSLRVDLCGAEEHHWDGAFPYGQSAAQWSAYALAPHSYLPLQPGVVQVGLNCCNRFLHLDVTSRSAQLIDPGVGNELLSTTNWFDPETEELWFASWAAGDTARRISDPLAPVGVTIWKRSLRDQRLESVWHGELGDALHQLTLSPDRRFLVLTELGLQPQEAKGLFPSNVLILNLQTGDEWRLALQTAGHVEFDPDAGDVCYLSEHNIGLLGLNVGIFGPGTIKKIRLTASGPELLGEFSHPRFHRITTHFVFRHRGKTLLAVTGYPNTVFLIDGATMKLYKTMTLAAPGEDVETAQSPHLCRQDSYGIAVSTDGEYLLAVGTGFVQCANIDDGRVSPAEEIGADGANTCFTGHLGTFTVTGEL